MKRFCLLLAVAMLTVNTGHAAPFQMQVKKIPVPAGTTAVCTTLSEYKNQLEAAGNNYERILECFMDDQTILALPKNKQALLTSERYVLGTSVYWDERLVSDVETKQFFDGMQNNVTAVKLNQEATLANGAKVKYTDSRVLKRNKGGILIKRVSVSKIPGVKDEIALVQYLFYKKMGNSMANFTMYHPDYGTAGNKKALTRFARWCKAVYEADKKRR